jgi:hypothetical protein
MDLRAELSERLMRDVDLIDLSRATTVLRKEVVAHGRLLFETDSNRRAEFEMYALSDYARLNEERAPVLCRSWAAPSGSLLSAALAGLTARLESSSFTSV